jgi:hypothetical protein
MHLPDSLLRPDQDHPYVRDPFLKLAAEQFVHDFAGRLGPPRLTEHGVLSWNAKLITALKRLDHQTASKASEASQHHATDDSATWNFWLPLDNMPLGKIAGVVWSALANQYAGAQSRAPAMTSATHTRIDRAHLRPSIVDSDGALMTTEGRRTGRLSPSAPAHLVDSIAKSADLNTQRLIRWLVAMASVQAFVIESTDPRNVVVLGGLRALAKRIGINGGKGAAQLRRSLDQLRHAELSFPGGAHHGLITWTLEKAAPKYPARLSIILNDPILPSFGKAMPGGSTARRRARDLVPVPLALPPLLDRRNDDAKLAHLDLLLMAEVRGQARELVRDGAVRIPQATWRTLADRCRMSRSLLDQVLDHWEGKVLMRDGDLVDLGPARSLQRAMIIAAGHTSIAGVERAKR